MLTNVLSSPTCHLPTKKKLFLVIPEEIISTNLSAKFLNSKAAIYYKGMFTAWFDTISLVPNEHYMLE